MTNKQLQDAIDNALEAVRDTAFWGTPETITNHLAELYKIQQERARQTDKANP